MGAWRLNAALSQWRAEINKRFPRRDRQSDGTIGDAAHAASSSQHNPDSDGSVDAYDMDVDLDGTNNDRGPADHIEALKQAFQKHPASQLWIHDGQIANRDIDNWRRRKYAGSNKHNRHIHWQTRTSGEKSTRPWEVDRVLDATNVKASTGTTGIGKRTLRKGMKGPDVGFLQRWLGVKPDDNIFGDDTEAAVRRYQKNQGITVDGIAGPQVFARMGVKR
jgi:murein L,D-transpeptidase YcbB/YkuD